MKDKLTEIISLCKRRGFVFSSCDIYGGLSAVWDYGPLGVLLKKNIKDIWWRTYVEKRGDIVGLDSSIVMSEPVFLASGHLESFTDLLVDCKSCKKRFKKEELIQKEDKFFCPECGAEIEEVQPRQFNLMIKTYLGPLEESSKPVYLRPETAQGIFTNFKNVLDTMHKKIPFGIAQIGKAFRNEITTKTFIFRTREFEQMEIEYFVEPEKAEDYYHYWVEERKRWYIEELGISPKNLRVREHSLQELAHYAQACSDVEFNFPFSDKENWRELEGIANRGDFDLSSHAKLSKEDLSYFDPEKNRRYIPYVIEPSAGVDRTFLALISDAYCEEEVRGRVRVVLKLDKRVSPYKIAVFPLLKNRPELVELARKIYQDLSRDFVSIYDDTAAIGKLYRRQDEIGTPFCVTVDVESLEDKKVTVRDRDTMSQLRIDLDNLKNFFEDSLRC
ncbi:MAG: glycine--tRNA ligase [Candidatus Omnitrophica bacterium]|nr:glycine--tRNA ligase [Candidatus Omnitrophota bacterium]